MLNNQQPKAFDSKTIIAILLIGVFYMGWQQYLAKKYPEHTQQQAAKRQAEQESAKSEPVPQAASSEQNEAQDLQVPPKGSSDIKQVSKPERLYKYEDDKVSFSVSSLGMAIDDFVSKVYSDRQGKPVTLTPRDPGLFQMTWGSERIPVSFDITQVEKNLFKGEAQIGSLTVERTLEYHPENYSFSQAIKVINPERRPELFSLVSYDNIQQPQSSSFFLPSYEHQDFLTFVGDEEKKFNISHEKEELEETIKAISLYSLGSQYFTVGFLDHSEVKSDLIFKTDVNTKAVVHSVNYKLPQREDFSFTQQLFIGPRSVDSLKSANEAFVSLMDYGMLAFISKPMMSAMKWFYSLVGNWGVAIILLTLLVRALVLPFNLMSYRSMKGMQKIQPILQQIREKYKDDPANLNREMMAAMKENKANPMAGCLPILLQLPIFFALYRVIGSSVELYQAPFAAWIQDLSLHDKYYVLPVLMGLTIFIQQKLTPTTLDPVQARVLTFMPIIFSVFMLNLPAGLTLYMVVSSIFGLIQQKTFMSVTK